MYLPKNEGGNFEQTPAGTFPARCYRFVDLGSHEQKYQGESKGMRRLIMISFELPTEMMTDGRPFVISKRYTWSMHDKSNMRHDLESWRGARFTDNDFGPGGFDTRDLIGVPATLTIVHSEREGSSYSNIASIGKAMKGLTVPDQINAGVYFSLEAERFNLEVFHTLSDKLKSFIQESPEWSRLNGGNSYAKQSNGETSRQQYDERNPPPSCQELDDEIPF